MTNLREAAQMALDALDSDNPDIQLRAATHLRAALAALAAEQEQEPVAYLCENAVGHKYFRWKKPPSTYKPIALYTAHASPQRIWQGLTDEEIIKLQHLIDWTAHWSTKKFARAIEAKLKEKNSA